MSRIIDLDAVFVSLAVYHGWMEVVQNAMRELAQRGVALDPKTIPDEQARVEDDGALTIFVDAPEIGHLEMRVPPEHWTWRR